MKFYRLRNTVTYLATVVTSLAVGVYVINRH